MVGIYAVNSGFYTAINRVYAKYLSTNPPARSFVPVASWPMEFDIEIECVAVAKGWAPTFSHSGRRCLHAVKADEGCSRERQPRLPFTMPHQPVPPAKRRFARSLRRDSTSLQPWRVCQAGAPLIRLGAKAPIHLLPRGEKGANLRQNTPEADALPNSPPSAPRSPRPRPPRLTASCNTAPSASAWRGAVTSNPTPPSGRPSC